MQDGTMTGVHGGSPGQIYRTRSKTDYKRHSWWIRNIWKKENREKIIKYVLNQGTIKLKKYIFNHIYLWGLNVKADTASLN